MHEEKPRQFLHGEKVDAWADGSKRPMHLKQGKRFIYEGEMYECVRQAGKYKAIVKSLGVVTRMAKKEPNQEELE